MRLAELKARTVWNNHPGSVVIGSDQVADLNGVRLGKPHTRERAIEQLLAMQGNTVVFTTALCVIDGEGKAEVVKSQTTVKLRPLSRETIGLMSTVKSPTIARALPRSNVWGLP